MKKILPTISLCLLCVISNAQLQLLSSEMLPYGSVMTDKNVLNISAIDTTITGAGAFWNFSSINNNVSVANLIVTIVDPATTPYGSSFPNSNYGYLEVQGSYTGYRYFDLNSAKMERVGSYVSNLNTYSDPQIEYVFPLELGTVSNDTWDNTNSSSGGTYDFECIGTGTLIIPGGSYDALMVRVHITESFLDYYAYFWYSADNGSVLLQYIVGDGVFITESANYLGSLTVAGVADNEFINGLAYNNPVQTELNLSFQSKSSGNYRYTAINAVEQEIVRGNTHIDSGSRENLNIDFSGYPAGIYFLTIQSEKPGEVKTLKIVKQ
jgi:hypothetical protein